MRVYELREIYIFYSRSMENYVLELVLEAGGITGGDLN